MLIPSGLQFEIHDGMDPGNLVESAANCSLVANVQFVEAAAAGSSTAPAADGYGPTVVIAPLAVLFQRGKAKVNAPVRMPTGAAAGKYKLEVSIDGLPNVTSFQHNFEFSAESLDADEREKLEERRVVEQKLLKVARTISDTEKKIQKCDDEITKIADNEATISAEASTTEAKANDAISTVTSLEYLRGTRNGLHQVQYRSDSARNRAFDALDSNQFDSNGVLGLVAELGYFEDTRVGHAIAQLIRGQLLDIVVEDARGDQWLSSEAMRLNLRSVNLVRNLNSGRWLKACVFKQGAKGTIKASDPQKSLKLNDAGALASAQNDQVRYGRCLGYAVNLVVLKPAQAELRAKLWYGLLRDTLVFETDVGMRHWEQDHDKYSNPCISLEGGFVQSDGAVRFADAPIAPPVAFAMPPQGSAPLDPRWKHMMKAHSDSQDLHEASMNLNARVRELRRKREKLAVEKEKLSQVLQEAKNEMVPLETNKQSIDAAIAVIRARKGAEGRAVSPDAPQRHQRQERAAKRPRLGH